MDLNVAATKFEQWTQDVRRRSLAVHRGILGPDDRHARQTLRPGAAQQLQQEGLRLIVEVMRKRHVIGVDRGIGTVAKPPRRGLHAGAVRCYLHAFHR